MFCLFIKRENKNIIFLGNLGSSSLLPNLQELEREKPGSPTQPSNQEKALIEFAGLAPGSLSELTDAELNVEIYKNWMLMGKLCLFLLQIAQRSRLSILVPSIFTEHPLKTKSTAEFLPSNAKLQQWYAINRESVRKWGFPHTLSEKAVMIKKTLDERSNSTAYQKKLTDTTPRPIQTLSYLA